MNEPLIEAMERLDDARSALRLLLTAIDGVRAALLAAIASQEGNPPPGPGSPGDANVTALHEVLGARPGETFIIETMGGG